MTPFADGKGCINNFRISQAIFDPNLLREATFQANKVMGQIKDCGWGRFGGHASLKEFIELRWISLQRPSVNTRF